MKKRSINIAGHATSITLEEAFWSQLKTIATRKGQSINALVNHIDANRAEKNLSSAIRLYILDDALNKK